VRPSLLREWAWVPSADASPCLRVQARQRVLGEPRSQWLGNAVAGQPLTVTFVDDREQPSDLSKAGSRQPRRVTQHNEMMDFRLRKNAVACACFTKCKKKAHRCRPDATIAVPILTAAAPSNCLPGAVTVTPRRSCVRTGSRST